MLTHLVLDNFKAFGSRQVIPLAPITLIFGANSAGKSSIIQSLLLLKQTIENAENPNQTLLFKDDFVDLGSFTELVFGHDTRRLVEISLIFQDDRFARRLSGPRPGPAVPNGVLGIGSRFGYDAKKLAVEPEIVPIYLGAPDQPALELDLKPASASAQRRAYRRYYTSGRISTRLATGPLYEGAINLDRDHPIWAEWWESYSEETLPLVKGGFQTLFDSWRSSRDQEQATFSDAKTETLLDERRDRELIEVFISRHLVTNNEGPAPDTPPATVDIERFVDAWKRKLESYRFDDFLNDSQRAEQGVFPLVEMRNGMLENVYTTPVSPMDTLIDPYFWREGDRRINSQTYRRARPLPDISSVARDAAIQHRRELRNLVYLGPLRGYPERHYIVGGRQTSTVGKLGTFAPDILYGNPEITAHANQKISEFGFGYELSLRELVDKQDPESQGGVFSVRLIDERTQTNVSLVDVGFGISQVLPVIVQSMLSNKSLIAIEQPEIHLHPGLQAELGSLFAECIREPYSNRFIIETHSEHLILRLQRLIRNGQLDPNEVSVLYVSREGGDAIEGSSVQQLRLDEDGDFLDPWPDGFFEDGYREMFGR